MKRPTQSVAQRLFHAQRVINNTLSSPIILAAVTPYGYDQAKLEAAHNLCQEARALTDWRERLYGQQQGATAAVQQAWTAAKVAYNDTLKIGRIALRGNESARNALGLSGIRQRSLNGWLGQARRFYNNLLSSPDFMASMATYGYTQAKLEAESALVEAVGAASDVQYQERGKAQEATQIRDAKLDELNQWLADYKKIAEIALAASPQQLEQLGWVVAS